MELIKAVLRLREEYPRWGKDKLVVLLRDEGMSCSASTVGRIIRRLKERGALKEPVANRISAMKRQRQRSYPVRKPKDYKVIQPGELGQLDTLEGRMSFPVKAIQVDGGSEFEAIFEEECRKRGIKLFILPPAPRNSMAVLSELIERTRRSFMR